LAESGNLWTNNDMSFRSSSTATVYWVEMFLNAHWMF
jgi:hypothetical protein